MAITARIDLSGSICPEDGCTKLLFNDTTGFVSAACASDVNILGYGLAGGIALNDVTSVKLNVYYPLLTTPILFTFTVASGVITAATLTDANLVSHNILTSLASTAFPLVNFDIMLPYGVAIPETVDGYYTWDYTIGGTSGGTVFLYTTSGSFLVTCTADCCIEKSYLDLDVNCNCFEDSIDDIIKSEVFLNGAMYALNIGQDSKATDFLTKAGQVCNDNCKDC